MTIYPDSGGRGESKLIMKKRIVLVLGAPNDYVLGEPTIDDLNDLEIAEIAWYDPDYMYRGEAACLWLRQLDADAFLMTEAVA